MSKTDGVSIVDEVSKLQAKVDKLLKDKYEKLSAWEKVLVARHPERPHFSNYCKSLVEDFVELSEIVPLLKMLLSWEDLGNLEDNLF